MSKTLVIAAAVLMASTSLASAAGLPEVDVGPVIATTTTEASTDTTQESLDADTTALDPAVDGSTQ